MRILIDITQLADWKGKLTGIPRVMYELSSRFEDDKDHEVVFLTWGRAVKVFQSISFTEAMQNREVTIVDNEEIVIRSLLYRALRKAYRRSPGDLKKILDRFKNIVNPIETGNEVTLSPFEFNKTDHLLIGWGEWGDADYRNKLKQVANEDGVSVYQIVYDMLPLVTPQYSSHSTTSLNDYVEEVYPICKKLISISENTKKDVVQWLKSHKLSVPTVELIRLGDDFEKATPVKPTNVFFKSKFMPYILCVGTVETRKNHTLLYYVYKLAKERKIELPKLVIVGRRGWLSENIYELITNDPNTKDSFVFMHDMNDEELAWIYEHSLFTIYPSHYEGWGLPVAESIAYKIPPIASNTSSIPEIAGDLIGYFSPVSTDECLTAITNLLKSKNLQVAKKKLELYKITTWDETFKQTKGIIEGKYE